MVASPSLRTMSAGDRRDARQQLAAGERGDRERLEVAAGDLGAGRGDRVDQVGHLAADQVRDRLRAPLVRHRKQRRLRLLLEQFEHRTARRGGDRDVDRVRFRTSRGSELAHVVDRIVRPGHDGERQHAGERDRLEIRFGIEAGMGVEVRRRRMGAVGSHQQRVAVGRRLGGELGADIAARAGAVLDHDVAAELACELLGDEARRHVGALPGRIGHDQSDRPRRVCLRQGGGRAAGQQQRQDEVARPGQPPAQDR